MMAQVVGKVEVGLKVPKEERAMPSFWGKLKVATMDENGHIIWPMNFEARTRAALRKQMKYHVKEMIENDEYPTCTRMAPSLAAANLLDSVREYPEPTQRAIRA